MPFILGRVQLPADEAVAHVALLRPRTSTPPPVVASNNLLHRDNHQHRPRQHNDPALVRPGVMAALRHHLGATSIHALRLGSKQLRDALDATITSLTAVHTPTLTLQLQQTNAALARWPHLRTVSLRTSDTSRCNDWALVKAINAGALRKLQTLSMQLVLQQEPDLTALISSFNTSTLNHLQHLDLARGTRLHDLSGVTHCLQLRSLRIDGAAALTDLSHVAACTRLRSLSLTRCRRLRSLAALARLTALQQLDLSGCAAVVSLAPLSRLTQLLTLDITACATAAAGDASLAPLRSCTLLQRLLMGRRASTLPGCAPAPLALPSLLHLDLSRDTSLQHLTLLSGCPQLRSLSLAGCRVLGDLTPLAHCPRLESLDASFCWSLTDLSPLSACAQLQRLSLSGCTHVSDFRPLARCTGLLQLDLSMCAALADVRPLAACVQLQRLDVRGTAVRELAPLVACGRGRCVLLEAATDEVSDDEDEEEEEP